MLPHEEKVETKYGRTVLVACLGAVLVERTKSPPKWTNSDFGLLNFRLESLEFEADGSKAQVQFIVLDPRFGPVGE